MGESESHCRSGIGSKITNLHKNSNHLLGLHSQAKSSYPTANHVVLECIRLHLEGKGVFDNSKAASTTTHNIFLLGFGDGLEVWNKSGKPLRFILVGGEPLNEPVVQFGPFVMNNQEEIDQKIDDFDNYTNGFEKARQWRSEARISLGF